MGLVFRLRGDGREPAPPKAPLSSRRLLTLADLPGTVSSMDLNDIDWGTQVDVKSDGAGSGAELTLAVLARKAVN